MEHLDVCKLIIINRIAELKAGLYKIESPDLPEYDECLGRMEELKMLLALFPQ